MAVFIVLVLIDGWLYGSVTAGCSLRQLTDGYLSVKYKVQLIFIHWEVSNN